MTILADFTQLEVPVGFYTESQKQLQAKFESGSLAERLEQAIVTDEIVPELHQPFIESRDFFFLATVNARGEPTVSHKGGPVGVVTVVDSKTLAFPSYDGNGMFLSMGNIAETSKIGMLFIDFETPNRMRVQATATLSTDDPLMAKYPGAQLLVRARVEKVFLNCARLVHKHQRVSASPYVPDKNGETPFPAWKRIDLVQDALPPKDVGRAMREGGVITQEDYGAKLAAGES
jgi:predicted pyridoxine 5'-phosphate oxidase superfamily flavin-nucleotide-binding protein